MGPACSPRIPVDAASSQLCRDGGSQWAPPPLGAWHHSVPSRPGANSALDYRASGPRADTFPLMLHTSLLVNNGTACPVPLPLGVPEWLRARTVPGGRTGCLECQWGGARGRAPLWRRRPRSAPLEGSSECRAAVLLGRGAEGAARVGCAWPGPSAQREPGSYRWSGPVRPGGAGRKEQGCFTASRRSGLVALRALCDGGIKGGRQD
ncbi:hypothetical protein NDU88_002378 [Pleurodeles waltl]|uniref:Uncharacterized protein n=1 Tax=Pleurodeles waltl TaxID=8319 RepID=A0AAV7UAL9_PLEWA|nr:hypothetical protein NDU88_002378 [Pleurodeles waltl]